MGLDNKLELQKSNLESIGFMWTIRHITHAAKIIRMVYSFNKKEKDILHRKDELDEIVNQ